MVLGVADGTSVKLLQDGWSVHKGSVAKQAVLDNDFDVLQGQPPRSPDLNPIEDVFGCMRRRLAALYCDPAKQHVSQAEFIRDLEDVLVDCRRTGRSSVAARTCHSALRQAVIQSVFWVKITIFIKYAPFVNASRAERYCGVPP